MGLELSMSDVEKHRNGAHLYDQNIRFYLGYELDKEATAKEGINKHRECEMVEITNFSGERTVRKVEPRDITTYQALYNEAKQAWGKPKTGTILEEWLILSLAQLADLHAFGFRTIEDVRDVNDTAVEKFPVLADWRAKATNWLDKPKQPKVELARVKDEYAKLEKRFKKLEDQYYLAIKRIESLEGTKLT